MQRTRLENRDEWLKERNKPMNGIGASESALVCGIKGAFGNLDELYDVKRGLRKPRPITNERIENGIKAEPLIRELFAIDHEGIYEVAYRGYDILRSDEHPFMTATLDGELKDLRNGELGIWECKNVTITKRSEMDEWDGRIPEKYLVQQIHQLEVTQWMFNILQARLNITEWLHTKNGNLVEKYPYKRVESRYSYIRRDDEDYRANADFIIGKESYFWDCVVNGRRPATRIF